MKENLEIKSFGEVHEDKRSMDHFEGAEVEQGTEVWKELKQPANNTLTWVEEEPEYEAQKKAGIETNSCVSQSGDNVLEYLSEWKRKVDSAYQLWLSNAGLIKNGKTNFSDRRTAKGSGTDPKVGNSVRAVDDYLRNYFFCPEDIWPFPEGMSRDEFYAVMPDAVANFHKTLPKDYEIQTKYLADSPHNPNGWYSDPEVIWEGLKKSPVWASVDGYYEVDANGLIRGEELKAAADSGVRNYNHRICIRAGVWGEYWEVHDSYLNQIRKFAWNYPFGACKIMRIVDLKKNPQEDYIQVGAAILFKGRGGKYKGQYISFSDGDVLKAIYGDYNKVTPRAIYPSLPDNFIGTLNINLK